MNEIKAKSDGHTPEVGQPQHEIGTMIERSPSMWPTPNVVSHFGGWRGGGAMACWIRVCCTFLSGWASHDYKTPTAHDSNLMSKALQTAGLVPLHFSQGLGNLMVPVSRHRCFTAVPTLFCALAFLVLIDHGIPCSPLLLLCSFRSLLLPVCSAASLFRRLFRGLFTGPGSAMLLPEFCHGFAGVLPIVHACWAAGGIRCLGAGRRGPAATRARPRPLAPAFRPARGSPGGRAAVGASCVGGACTAQPADSSGVREKHETSCHSSKNRGISSQKSALCSWVAVAGQ